MPIANPHCRLAIKVVPNAPRNQIAGWLGDALKVKVHAPPLDGRANDELCQFLAEAFGLPARSVALVSGEKSRQKVIQILGLDRAQVEARVRSATEAR
jgi:uncharacterized protein (TIGR00251 family)